MLSQKEIDLLNEFADYAGVNAQPFSLDVKSFIIKKQKTTENKKLLEDWEILEKHCPSMNNLYLDDNGRAFRDRIINAMNEYLKQST